MRVTFPDGTRGEGVRDRPDAGSDRDAMGAARRALTMRSAGWSSTIGGKCDGVPGRGMQAVGTPCGIIGTRPEKDKGGGACS